MTWDVTALVSVAGTALNAVYAWPQVTRALRTVVGLSLGTVLLGYVSRLAWACYAVVRHDLGLLAGQLPPALAFLTLAVVVIRRRPALRTRALVSLGLFSSGTLGVAWCLPLLSAVAVATAALTAVPQLLAPATPGAAAGVSGRMYVLAAAASATWLTYGLLLGDPVIYLSHALILPTSALVAVRAAYVR